MPDDIEVSGKRIRVHQLVSANIRGPNTPPGTRRGGETRSRKRLSRNERTSERTPALGREPHREVRGCRAGKSGPRRAAPQGNLRTKSQLCHGLFVGDTCVTLVVSAGH